MAENKKHCNGCGLEKSVDDFYSRGDNTEGLRSQCKLCYTKKTTQRTLFWQSNNKEERRKADLKHALKNVYKISEQEYRDLLTSQNNLCAICEQPEQRSYKGSSVRLSIDHCHFTGKVRALLCSKCNTALGLLDDNIDRFIKCISYIATHAINIEDIPTIDIGFINE